MKGGDFVLKKLMLLIAVTLIASVSFAAGQLDIVPQYFMGDTTTPFVVHFQITDLGTYTSLSVKARMTSAATTDFSKNAYTWSTLSSAWGDDGYPWIKTSVFPISGGVASGWLIVKNKILNSYGICSIKARAKVNGGTSTNYVTSTTTITSLDSATNGGWIAGNYMSNEDKIVLVKDDANNVLGSGLTENNNVNEGYASTNPGYFKVALPAGTRNLKLSFLNKDGSSAGSDYNLGSVTINANKTNSAFGTVPVELSGFISE